MGTPAADFSFAARWRTRRRYTYLDLISALGALVVGAVPCLGVPRLEPFYWVLADVCAGIVLFLVELGRWGAFGRVCSRLLLLGTAILMLWMLSDGVVSPPVLFVVYALRGWRFASRNPRGALDESSRALAAATLAGMVTAVIGGLTSWAPVSMAVFAVLFFLLSALIHLYPVSDWLTQDVQGREP